MIVINILGIVFCIAMLIIAFIFDQVGTGILGALLLCLNTALLIHNIEKRNGQENVDVTIVETKTPPTIDTLIRYGSVPDTTYVITAVDAKVR